MSQQLYTLRLNTQPVYGSVQVRHYSNSGELLTRPFVANIVTAMELADGSILNNPDHSTAKFAEPRGEDAVESITLASSKAKRLLHLFERLEPGHGLECHDLVKEVEGWEYDRGPELEQRAVQPADLVKESEEIEPGTPYTVQIMRGTIEAPNFGRSHSCLGTDEGRLLGLVGRGLSLATMDPESTRTLYANGSVFSFLAKTILPTQNI